MLNCHGYKTTELRREWFNNFFYAYYDAANSFHKGSSKDSFNYCVFPPSSNRDTEVQKKKILIWCDKVLIYPIRPRCKHVCSCDSPNEYDSSVTLACALSLRVRNLVDSVYFCTFLCTVCLAIRRLRSRNISRASWKKETSAAGEESCYSKRFHNGKRMEERKCSHPVLSARMSWSQNHCTTEPKKHVCGKY